MVCTKLNLEYSFARDFVFATSAQQLCALACEHAAHDKLDAASLLERIQRRKVLAVKEFLASHKLPVRFGFRSRLTLKHFEDY